MFGISHVRFGFRKISYRKLNKHTNVNDDYIVFPWRIIENAWYMLLKWLAYRNDRRLIVVETSQRNIDFVAGKINAFGEPILPKNDTKDRSEMTPEQRKNFDLLMNKLNARSKGVNNEYKIDSNYKIVHQETIKKDINNG